MDSINKIHKNRSQNSKVRLGVIGSLAAAGALSAFALGGESSEKIVTGTHSTKDAVAAALADNRIDKEGNKINRQSESQEKVIGKLVVRTFQGDTVAADILLDEILEASRNDMFEEKLADLGISENEYRLVQRGRNLRQMLNEVDDENLSENATTEMNRIGYPEENAGNAEEQYLHKRMEQIDILLNNLSPEDAENETFLKMAELTPGEFKDLVYTNAEYYKNLFGRPTINKERLEKFGIRNQ